MSNQYNSRLRPAEVLVNGNNFALIRRRETLEDITRTEIKLDFEILKKSELEAIEKEN
jgi:diaminopimelate decarboxylase